MKRLIILWFLLFSVAACEKQAKTVDFYMQHEAERLAILEDCQNDIKKLREDGDCLNAIHAKRKVAEAERLEKAQKERSPGLGRSRWGDL